MKHIFFSTILVSIVLASLWVQTVSAQHDRISLDQVKTITLFKNKFTNARRTSPIPQLTCVGSMSLCNQKYMPSTVQCYNMGSDGFDAQWKCDAELDSDVAFDTVHVSCEGYHSPDDHFILDGSCGLEYKLKYTNSYYARPKNTYTTTTTTTTSTSDGSGSLIFWIIVAIFAVIAFLTCCSNKPRVTPIPSAPMMEPYGQPVYGVPVHDPTGAFVSGVHVGATMAGAPRYQTHHHYHNDSSMNGRTTTTTTSSEPSGTTHKSSGFGTTTRR